LWARELSGGGGEAKRGGKKKEKKKDKSPFHLRFAARRDSRQDQQPGPANVLIKATRNISIPRVPYIMRTLLSR